MLTDSTPNKMLVRKMEYPYKTPRSVARMNRSKPRFLIEIVIVK